MTSEEPLDRKLAAILYADVAGYSALTGEDEEGTHRRLSDYLDSISETIQRQGGTVVHYAGDAVLADFRTATDALACAVEIQRALKEKNENLPKDRMVQFRIGVNLGEVIVDRDDIYGDGVNVAARLESLAEPGGICLSQGVYAAVGKKLPFVYENIGPQKVKNIAEPVPAYRVVLGPESASARLRTRLRQPRVVGVALFVLAIGAGVVGWLVPWDAGQETASIENEGSPSTDMPSIAVLPFQNLSDDPKQEYFSDGVTNDIITDLSRFSNLLVIASNSVFTFKGKPVKVKEVGLDLGVRYVLEGSIQKVGDNVRINAQLIDTITDGHLWAERFDIEMVDIFAAQDQITDSVVTALEVILTQEEKGREARRYTNSLQAYELFLRGRNYLRGTRQTHTKARELFDQAIALDPEFAAAYAEKSLTYFPGFIMPMTGEDDVLEAALEAADRAIALDDSLPIAHARRGWALFAARRHADAIAAGKRAVTLGPSDAESHVQLGNILNWTGRPEEGIAYIEKAMQLNPHYPFYYLFYLGHSHYLLGNREKAIALMKRVIARAPYFLPVRRHLAVLFTEVGLLEEAKSQTEEVLRIFPGASIEDERARCFYKWEPELQMRFFDGLRQSGMPDGEPGREPVSM